ncbi:MAG: efflux RND transporter periplasmic adaptor subunit [Burkholderiaceae bacterium]|nr:efflux RND transporter periplasmic adaptor subunit [Aquabacterium sp.]NUP84363.1 efflux RND transporter periplasmic adaptor subunit [Burkholderiaceae bacterium]
MSKSWRPWAIGLLALAVLAAVGLRLTAARRTAATAATAAASAPRPALELAPIDVLTVGRHEFVRGLEVTGSLKAVNTAYVKAKIAAELRTLEVREGDAVRAGQVVATLDTTEFDWRLRQAEQQAAAARAQAEIAQRQLANNKALVAQGFISATALETSASNEAAAQANLQAAMAAAELARKARADTTVVAPISGQVSQRLAQPGERVSVDARLIEIVDLTRIELEAGVPPEEAARVRPGAIARLTLEGSSEPLAARVVRLNPAALAGSRTVAAYLAVEPHPSLRHGLFARGWIDIERRQALAIPASAVRIDQAKPYAIVYAQGRAERRSLQLGERGMVASQPMVEVLGGLAEGERILAASAGSVPEGTALRVATLAAPAASKSH